MSEFRSFSNNKTARTGLVLLVSVLLSACLHLDLGTVLSLNKMDPYTVNLADSRVAVFLPEGIAYSKTVAFGVRMVQGKKTLDKQRFDLEAVADGEPLPGIDLTKLPRRPIVIRLAKADVARAIDLQKRLSIRDKYHKWIDPEDDSASEGAGKAKGQDSAQGLLDMYWALAFNKAGHERFCEHGKTVRVWIWVRLNDSPQYRRVVHGLPLKSLYGKQGIRAMCAQKPVEADGPMEAPGMPAPKSTP